MKIAKNLQMKMLDKIAIDEYSIPGIILMENAGIAVTQEILKEVRDNSEVVIFCGTGNNGGDGFVIARQLLQRGIGIQIFTVGDESSIKGDAQINYLIVKKMGIPLYNISSIDNINEVQRIIVRSEVIVDAIFGTGFHGQLHPITTEVVNTINRSDRNIVSVDIPSGVHGDGGPVDNAIRANKTIVLQLPKIANVVYPGAEYCGKIIVKNIGIPEKVVNEFETNIYLNCQDDLKSHILKRAVNTHKGTYGLSLIIAGSKGMPGAAVLAAKSCLRSGVGLLKVLIPEEISSGFESNVIEAISIPYKDKYVEKVIESLQECDSIAIGPGLGKSIKSQSIMETVLKNRKSDLPTVIDADGLNILAENKLLFKYLDENCVLTPHPGEMSRMTGLTVKEINENRIEVTSKYAKLWNTNIVLKGAGTIISSHLGIIYVNTTGNPGMSTAGSGDVLTGIITAFTSRGIGIVDATRVSVFLHGIAGDRVARKIGEDGLIASDIINEIPRAIKSIKKI